MATTLRLWRGEAGAIVSAEFMVVAAILVIGAIVGWKSSRAAAVTEMADVAQAVANIDQSFGSSGTVGHHGVSSGARFNDLADFCDRATLDRQQNSKCVVICDASLHPFGFGADGAQHR
ncbi:MAG: hypothetical protein JNM18_07285 [Planctomycetaceae bacterium]|nr:hypothetical protein [Planctomycetaceae bacterium]